MMIPNLPQNTSANPLAAQSRPSDTNLLMALAEMHRQGRFNDTAPATTKTQLPRSVVKRAVGRRG